MLKNKKNHHVPEPETHKHHQIKSHGGYATYDPLHDLEPMEVVNEKMELVKKWILNEESILLGLLIGSYARGEQRDDSDIDYILMVDNPDEFMLNTNWIKFFGVVVSAQSEVYEEVNALRVYYQDNIELEFGFVKKDWLEMPMKEATREALSGGYEVLKDMNGQIKTVEL